MGIRGKICLCPFAQFFTKLGSIKSYIKFKLLENWLIYRVTIPLAQNILLKSTGGFEQVEWSPCIMYNIFYRFFFRLGTARPLQVLGPRPHPLQCLGRHPHLPLLLFKPDKEQVGCPQKSVQAISYPKRSTECDVYNRGKITAQ